MRSNSSPRQPKYKGAVPKGAASGTAVRKFGAKNIIKSTKGKQKHGR
jgi:hypothetical protein